MQQKKQSVYSQIADDIINKIKNDVYPLDSMLPPERELMKIYDVERTTVRRGLELLSKNGYIRKVAGLGSIVTSKNRVDITDTDNSVSSGLTHTNTVENKNEEFLAIVCDKNNPDYLFSRAVVDSLYEQCQNHSVNLHILDDDEKAINSFIKENKDVNKCVVFPGVSRNCLQTLENSGLNICFALCKVDGYRCFLPDISEACDIVSGHLENLGHTNIAFIGSEESSYLQRELRIRFTDAVVKQIPESTIGQFTNTGGFDEKSGFERLSELIRRAGGNFTCAVCVNDLVAEGALKAAKYYKLSVPEDLSIISLCGFESKNTGDSIIFSCSDLAREIFYTFHTDIPCGSNVTIYCGGTAQIGKTTAEAKSGKNSARRLSDFLL